MLDFYELVVILFLWVFRFLMYVSLKCVFKIICEWWSDIFLKVLNLKREVWFGYNLVENCVD